jgi:hypothetical protein
LIIWLIFFLFLQTKPSFCRLFAWSQLDFSAIPVSISSASLRRLSTYVLLDLRLNNGKFPLSHIFQILFFQDSRFKYCIILLDCQFINNISDNSCLVSTQHTMWGQRGEWQLYSDNKQTNLAKCKQRVHSHAPSIRSHRGTYRKWFSRFLANESLRKTDLHLSLSFGKIPFLPHCI